MNAAGNRDFVRSFAQHVVPEGEHAQFMTDDGTLSTEGANRVRNALTQHAYGNNDLVSSLAEQADPNFRAFGGAMQDAAGPMASCETRLTAGTSQPVAILRGRRPRLTILLLKRGGPISLFAKCWRNMTLLSSVILVLSRCCGRLMAMITPEKCRA